MIEPPHAQGATLYRQGDYQEAAAVFGGLLAEAPDDATALRMLGLCRVRLGEPEAAEKLLARAAALAPDNAEALLHWGIGLLACGRAAEAAALFTRASALLPDDPAPPLNLATALLAAGNPAAARGAARRAAARAPRLPQAHYMRGLAELALGALPAAAAAFARATEYAPDFAEAWVNRGVIAYRQYDIAAAKDAMRRALGIAPDHPAATVNLASFERISGEVEDGDARLQAALARDPDNAELRLAHATVQLGEAGAQAALAVLEAMPPAADPTLNLHWRLQRLLALILLNRLDEARAGLAELGAVPAELAPLLEFRRLLLAQRERAPDRARAHAEVMERQLRAAPAMLPEHRIMGWIDLGRFWRRQSEPDRAFASWTEGHRLLGRLQPFSRAEYAAFVDATIARSTPDGCATGRAPPTPIRRRSSSSACRAPAPRFTEQILAAHAAVHGAGERPHWRRVSRAWRRLGEARRRRGASPPGAPAWTRGARAIWRELHALAPDRTASSTRCPAISAISASPRCCCRARGSSIASAIRATSALSIFAFRFYG